MVNCQLHACNYPTFRMDDQRKQHWNGNKVCSWKPNFWAPIFIQCKLDVVRRPKEAENCIYLLVRKLLPVNGLFFFLCFASVWIGSIEDWALLLVSNHHYHYHQQRQMDNPTQQQNIIHPAKLNREQTWKLKQLSIMMITMFCWWGKAFICCHYLCTVWRCLSFDNDDRFHFIAPVKLNLFFQTEEKVLYVNRI